MPFHEKKMIVVHPGQQWKYHLRKQRFLHQPKVGLSIVSIPKPEPYQKDDRQRKKLPSVLAVENRSVEGKECAVFTKNRERKS